MLDAGSKKKMAENDQDDAVGSCRDQRSALRAPCVVCDRTMPVTKAGVVRVHGPLGNRCTGSGMSCFFCLLPLTLIHRLHYRPLQRSR